MEAIFGARFGRVGALVSLPGKMWGRMWGISTPKCGANLSQIYLKIYPKIYGNPTTHLGGEIPKIVGNRERCLKFEIGYLGSPISKSVIPYWKMDDFGGVEVAGLAGGWLAGRVS